MNSAKDTMVVLGSRRGPMPAKVIGRAILCLLRDASTRPFAWSDCLFSSRA
ncbi:hypothetical protein [Cohaesibacter intestini]|uniref:hypothetical protein n=1 Tax=Cohaesibacter intestini TaxID=2211145 RepID=UPI001300279F|nr:hypothetical protein [Cohaesibacter intestini]